MKLCPALPIAMAMGDVHCCPMQPRVTTISICTSPPRILCGMLSASTVVCAMKVSLGTTVHCGHASKVKTHV